MTEKQSESSRATRRDFLKATTAVAASAALASLSTSVHAAGSDTINAGEGKAERTRRVREVLRELPSE